MIPTVGPLQWSRWHRGATQLEVGDRVYWQGRLAMIVGRNGPRHYLVRMTASGQLRNAPAAQLAYWPDEVELESRVWQVQQSRRDPALRRKLNLTEWMPCTD